MSRSINTLFPFFIIVLLLSCGSFRNQQDAEDTKTFEADWLSLEQYEVPEWFKDAKLGIFIHWGPYAVPAYCNEWYPNRMYDSTYTRNHPGLSWYPYGYHLETYGNQKNFGYKDFIPQFKAEKFDPEAWVDLFENAGAKYIVPVGEHHDGFAMYASTLTRWNSVEMGPKRDVAGEIAEAARDRGLKFGISSHYTTNWTYYRKDPNFDTSDPEYFDLYGRPHEDDAPPDQEFVDHFTARTREMIDLYKPDLIWFDGGLSVPEFMHAKMDIAAYYYNKGVEWNKGLVYNYKNNDLHHWPDGCGVLDIERGKLKDIRKEPWQTDTALGLYNWGYTRRMVVKSTDNVLDDLIDIVSKNGNLLLNVSPMADGTIPEAQKKVLMEMGDWLAINGEAIYGTRPWKIFGEGPTSEDLEDTHMAERRNLDRVYTKEDIRFTRKGRDIYVICMGDAGKEILVENLRKDSPYWDYEIHEIRMLGSEEVLEYDLTEAGLRILLPENGPDTRLASAFKIVAGKIKGS